MKKEVSKKLTLSKIKIANLSQVKGTKQKDIPTVTTNTTMTQSDVYACLF